MENHLKDFVFITGNQHKADFLQKWIGMPVAHHKLDLDELQSLDLRVVAEHKARQAYDILNRPVLVEDASLTFTAMGRLPGTYIKWFIEEMGIEGIADLASHLSSQEAVGRVIYALHDGNRVRHFEGQMRGHIAARPQGDSGFGFDPIFVNEGFSVTRAQMSESDYATTSYRTDAMNKLRAFLNS